MRINKISASTFCLAASLYMGLAGCKSNGTGTDSSTVNAATDPADVNNAPPVDPNAPQQAAG